MLQARWCQRCGHGLVAFLRGKQAIERAKRVNNLEDNFKRYRARAVTRRTITITSVATTRMVAGRSPNRA